jgi:hypothetical protein
VNFEETGIDEEVDISLLIRSTNDADRLMEMIKESTKRALHQIARDIADPLQALKRIKFEPVGLHPIADRPLNFIEQVNQSWTYIVALEAAKKLLELHPDAGGFRLAPGAHASLELDIMSVEPGYVGAETFAAVHPRNNGKLRADLTKLASRPERYRYVFFMSPKFPTSARQHVLEKDGVQVWSVAL